MKTVFTNTLKLVVVASALCASGSAAAQAAGTWTAIVGLNKVTPKVSSGDLTAPSIPGVKIDVAADTQPLVTINYAITDNIAASTFIGTAYKHEQFGDGTIAGAGKLGVVDVLPVTLLAQYHFFDAKAKFRPFVGAGLTYAYFRNEVGSGALTALTNTGNATPTTYKVDSKWGTTFKLGASYAFNDRWFAAAAISKTFVKTTSRLSTGQTIDLTLDPIAVMLGIGYHF